MAQEDDDTFQAWFATHAIDLCLGDNELAAKYVESLARGYANRAGAYYQIVELLRLQRAKP